MNHKTQALKYILLDLDGTLLPLDIDKFVAEYFTALAPSFAEVISPQQFVSYLLKSTEQMVINQDPLKTNEQVFVADFAKRTGIEPMVFMPIFNRFYDEKFTNLQKEITGEPIVHEILAALVQKGYDLVIATNPVFPFTAINERMRWAGVDDFKYAFVTSFENMHYCKPSTGYYAEVMDKLSAEPEQCLMIGNDVDEDLAAARLGIKTYLLTDYLINRHDREYCCDYHGSIADLKEFVVSEL